MRSLIDHVGWLVLQFLDRLVARIRREHLLHLLSKTGGGSNFDPRSAIVTPSTVAIGENVFIGLDAHFSGEITIGSNCMFGPGLMLIGGDHYFGVNGMSVRVLKPFGKENDAPIIIDEEVWGGARLTILGGVHIGMGAVLGAGSVVSKSIPPYVVAVGNPCRPIKRIFEDEALFGHLKKLGKDDLVARSIVQERLHALQNTQGHILPAVDHTKRYLDASQPTKPYHD